MSKEQSESSAASRPNGTLSSPSLPNGVEESRPRSTLSNSTQAKKLYEGPRDGEGYKTWLDEPPQEIADGAAKKSQRRAHPLLLRYMKSVDKSGDKIFKLDSLVVQSEAAKIAVRYVLKDYPAANQYGVHTDEPTFDPPFVPFFHRWDRFEQYRTDHPTNADVELLYSVLDDELRPLRREASSLAKHQVITWPLLWTLYPPGTEVYAQLNGQDHLFTAKRTRKRQLPQGLGWTLDITLSCIDWDGVKYGYAEETASIIEYAGDKRINELDAFPKEFHPDEKALMERLANRGEKWSTLVQGLGYKAYNGVVQPSDYSSPRYVEGRIVIDCAGFIKNNQYIVTPLEPFSEHSSSSQGSSMEDEAMPDAEASPAKAEEGNGTLPEEASLDVASSIPVPKLRSEQKPFCRSTVRGYSLVVKKWAEFEADRIEEISWNENAFAKLVMSPARKRLIQALVKEQSVAQQHFDDVIQGKGLGLIMLLSGPPGTGKTLTAESIADALRLPFYILQATELGDDIQQIEKSLQKVFELVAGWNAVMLLDEADAFLEKRTDELSPEGVQRNKRVAAFLRLLEYYKGTLILTTNRPITFDDAFSSRIHLTLPYRPLDPATRKAIWANFLEGVASDADLNRLSLIDMNGREIKNVNKMARLLAKNEGEDLRFGHIRDIMEVIEVSLDA